MKQKFFFEVGETIYSKDRTLLVLDRGVRTKKNNPNHKERYYVTKCLDCGWSENIINETQLKIKAVCSCCTGKIVVKGINDLATTHPHLIKYFANKEESYTYGKGSHERLEFKCAHCGFTKEKTIKQIIRDNGFACPKCSDGISFPEKFVFEMLHQLKIEVIPQYSKKESEWCKEYRYDFYLPKFKMIIEVHGKQHYTTPTGSWSMSKNDEEKKKIALMNGIRDYIVIDAKTSKSEDIIQSIKESGILDKIANSIEPNWLLCEEQALHSRVVQVCSDKNNNPFLPVKNIANKYGLHETTVLSYLKTGGKLGLCYNSTRFETQLSRGQIFFLYRENQPNSKFMFLSKRELEELSEGFFDKKVKRQVFKDVQEGDEIEGYVYTEIINKGDTIYYKEEVFHSETHSKRV